MNVKGSVVFLTLAWLSLVATAAEAPLQPGVYVTEGGWGVLKVMRAQNGATTFNIEAMGANGHSCGLHGEIGDGRAVLESFEKDKPCTVTFAAAGSGVRVGITKESVYPACRYFCGMRADFEGEYLKTPSGCAPAEIKRTREEFKRLYGRKDYATARAKLEPAFGNCGKFIDWLDTGWIRNDLALVQLRAGDAAACLRTLEPLAKDAAKSDAQIERDIVSPTDVENWLPVVKAARTNLKLCGAARPR